MHELFKKAIQSLSPHVTVFSHDQTAKLKQMMVKAKIITEPKPFVWQPLQHTITVDGPAAIIPALERGLGQSIETITRDIYLFAYPDTTFDRIIKTDLTALIDNYSALQFGPYSLCCWAPSAGYVFETDPTTNKITIGIIPTYIDPFPNPTTEKDSSSCRFFKTDQFRAFIRTFDIDVIGEKQANELLEKFRAAVPLTIWGHIDGDKLDKKLVIGTDIAGIIPALEKLTGKTIDLNEQVYLELVDPDLPLIKTALKNAIETIPQTYHLSFDLFIFNEKMTYVIGVDPLHAITIGIITS